MPRTSRIFLSENLLLYTIRSLVMVRNQLARASRRSWRLKRAKSSARLFRKLRNCENDIDSRWNTNADIHCRGMSFIRAWSSQAIVQQQQETLEEAQSGEFLFAVLFKEIVKQKKNGRRSKSEWFTESRSVEKSNEREGRRERIKLLVKIYIVLLGAFESGRKSKQDRFYSSLGIISAISYVRLPTGGGSSLPSDASNYSAIFHCVACLSSHCLSLLSLAHRSALAYG